MTTAAAIVTAILHLLIVYTSPRGVVYIKHARERAGGAEQYARELGTFYQEAADFYGVNVWLPVALGYYESGFDRARVGAAGELDVMQLNPASRWGREYARACRPHMDPMLCTWSSVWIGTGALVDGIRECGEAVQAVAWYRSGECEPWNRLEKPAAEKAKASAERVIALWKRLKSRGGNMTTTTTTKDEGPRSFAVFIQALAEGDANAELSQELHRLGKILRKEADHRGEEVSGAMTVVFRVTADPRGTAHFKWSVKLKEPEKKRVGAAMWTTRAGNFVNADPRQPELFPREVRTPKPYDVVDVDGTPLEAKEV